MTIMNHLPMNFGGLEAQYAIYDTAHVVILPVPYEATTTLRAGTREGPGAIIRASRGMELYDEELRIEPYQCGIHTLDEPELSLATMESPHRQIEEIVDSLIIDGKFPIVVGGEHSLSLGPVRAFAKRYPDLTVLQLDAHADLRQAYNDTPYSHACIGRRILEVCPLVQVGIRSLSREEADFLNQGQIENILFASDLLYGRRTFADYLARMRDNVYVTIDLDAFDPSEMPAVGTPEPGGLGWYQVLDILRQVSSNRNIVGVDVVELCPLPGNVAPDFLAAKLIYKIVGQEFADILT